MNEPRTMPPSPRMSFFRRPIMNTLPCREASPEDIFKYLISDYAKAATEELRTISDPKARSRYKAANFDYITPAGLFKSRKETDLILPSGYIVIDFDHLQDPSGLVIRLASDEHFETVLAFRSPSGDGVKWIVSLPDIPKTDGTPLTHGDYFTMLSNYSLKYYGIQADPSGKDICRACFLPYDPEAFLNPFYIEDNFDYDITRFLSTAAR
ncbi:MAG: BT4734/BF3469 family protein [Bacteroidia bacterium]|nr:BT4734/BF3469 family protein [Bacteroidia bacterium]